MCKIKFKDVIRRMTKAVQSVSEADYTVAKSAITWIRLALVPIMSKEELTNIKNLIDELDNDILAKLGGKHGN